MKVKDDEKCMVNKQTKEEGEKCGNTDRHKDLNVWVKDGGVVVHQQGVQEGQCVNLHVAAGILVPGTSTPVLLF